MNSKLTLSIKQEIIEKAKQFAKSSDRSLSDIVERYLSRLVAEHPETLDELYDERIDSWNHICTG